MHEGKSSQDAPHEVDTDFCISTSLFCSLYERSFYNYFEMCKTNANITIIFNAQITLMKVICQVSPVNEQVQSKATFLRENVFELLTNKI